MVHQTSKYGQVTINTTPAASSYTLSSLSENMTFNRVFIRNIFIL